jgi:hypothetical protein
VSKNQQQHARNSSTRLSGRGTFTVAQALLPAQVVVRKQHDTRLFGHGSSLRVFSTQHPEVAAPAAAAAAAAARLCAAEAQEHMYEFDCTTAATGHMYMQLK